MIRLDSVSKRFPNGQIAVDALTLEIPAGETCVLVGPSGCGKTTTLKMINRLIEPTSGRIFLDDEDVTRADPVRLRRRIGYVIQQVGLFPHQTIGTNVGTVPACSAGRRTGSWSGSRSCSSSWVSHPTSTATGTRRSSPAGRSQRVGVARALAADPPVLLMDEPFGAIDPVTRMRLQDEFLRLQSEVRKTVVFVTHDIEEAVKMGDRICILEVGGKLAQYDTPAEVLGSPASPFVADFVGADRGLKRLRVTPIARDTLEHPPTVLPSASLADARAAIERSGADWVAVVTGDGRLVGHVRRDQADGDGPVSSGTERLEAWVSIEAPLEDALASMLLTDLGWVAVLDGDRFLGVLTPESVYLTLRRSLDGAQTAAAAPGP